MIQIILLYALFGSTTPISKFLLYSTPPLFLSGLRLLVAGTILLLFQYRYKSTYLNVKARHAGLFVRVALFSMYLNYLFKYWGLSQIGAAHASFLITAISPFFTALFAYMFFSETISYKQWIGLITGLSGLIPLMLVTKSNAILCNVWPVLSIFFSAACYCYGQISLRILIRDHHYSASLINGICMIASGFLGLVTSLICHECIVITHVKSFAIGFLLLILISNVLCRPFYDNLLRQYSTTFLSCTDFLHPLFASLYSWLFLHETISWHFGIASCIVCSGLYLFYQNELQQHNTKIAKI